MDLDTALNNLPKEIAKDKEANAFSALIAVISYLFLGGAAKLLVGAANPLPHSRFHRGRTRFKKAKKIRYKRATRKAYKHSHSKHHPKAKKKKK